MREGHGGRQTRPPPVGNGAWRAAAAGREGESTLPTRSSGALSSATSGAANVVISTRTRTVAGSTETIPESGGGRIATSVSKLSVLPSTFTGEVGRRIFFSRNVRSFDSDPFT